MGDVAWTDWPAVRAVATLSVMSPRNHRSTARRRAQPVTVTKLPVVRCAVCERPLPHRVGQASDVLTDHYERAHPDVTAR